MRSLGRFAEMKSRRNVFVDYLSKPDKYPLQYFWVNFIFITPALGLAVNGLSNIVFTDLCDFLVGKIGGSKLGWQLLISFCCIGIVLLMASNVSQRLRRLKSKIWGNPELETRVQRLRTGETFAGLIAIASYKKNAATETPAEYAIRHHWEKGQLKHCWLICSKDVLKSTDEAIQSLNAQNIPINLFKHDGSGFKQQFDKPINGGLNLYQIQIQSKTDDSLDLAHDPNYIRELVDWIYQDAIDEMGLAEEDIIADYTGGTKSMTAGVVLACTHPERRIQYIWSQYNERGEIQHSEVWEVKVSYKIQPIKAA
jgi:hypothetical protein